MSELYKMYAASVNETEYTPEEVEREYDTKEEKEKAEAVQHLKNIYNELDKK